MKETLLMLYPYTMIIYAAFLVTTGVVLYRSGEEFSFYEAILAVLLIPLAPIIIGTLVSGIFLYCGYEFAHSILLSLKSIKIKKPTTKKRAEKIKKGTKLYDLFDQED